MVDTTKQNDFFNASKFELPVHIIGCGGMGGRVAEGLVRMGVGTASSPIHLYDGDSYEPHNLANQFVGKKQIGQRKVYALQSQLLQIEPSLHISSTNDMVTKPIELSGVVFLCLDSMQPRGNIVQQSLEGNTEVACVIETRMDVGVGISHCFDPNNKMHCECWWLYWYPDTEAENLAGCGGPTSIISAIFGTTKIALKQFEDFAKRNSACGVKNRIYEDFDYCEIESEVWPT